MAARGSNRRDGSIAINSNNIFSALESRHRKSKKKPDNGGITAKDTKAPPPLPTVWPPIQLSIKSWADCEEDDDDFLATTAPLPTPAWSSAGLLGTTDDAKEVSEESEGDDLGEEEVEDDVEDETATDMSESKAEVISQNLVSVSTAACHEPDKQLSKKERKKKELAELEAVLAEFASGGKNMNALVEPSSEKMQDLEVNKEDNRLSLAEGKNSKRRKAKKEKICKETKDENVNPTMNTDDGPKDTELGTAPSDPKEALKRLALQKKKKKNIDSAAKAAAAEAFVRASKLAAAKKKEKSHYNQQPVR